MNPARSPLYRLVTTLSVFADVQNIYYTTRQAYQRQFNYRACWEQLSRNATIVSAFAYAIDRGDAKQRQFQNRLREIGFEVKLKPYIQRRDGSSKGDWDVGITIDVMEHAAKADNVVLLSGDGDFDLLVSTIKRLHKVRVTVYGVPQLTAKSLIDAADEFHPIDEALLL